MPLTPNEHLLSVDRVVESMHERAQAVRLDRNERVVPMPRAEFARILATLTPESFCSYPDPAPLYAALSRTLGVPESMLYLTNGSDAALRMLFQAFLRPGDEVVFADPSYAMYSIYTRVFGGVERSIPYGDDLCLDWVRVFALLERGPRIFVLANPDQPTGAVTPASTIMELAGVADRAGTLFIVDEAYYPFHPDTAIGLVEKFANLVVTRTFSKMSGIAGLRLGYLCAHRSIVHDVQRVRGAHEVNAIAIAVGTYMLEHPELGETHVDDVRRGRAELACAAAALGLGFPSCPANFQLLRFPGVTDTTGIVAGLKRRGYLVKGCFAAPALRDCIRVTLGPPKVMSAFAAALTDLIREQRA